MAKTTEKTPKTRSNKGRMTRPQVISFRITAAQAKILAEIYKREPASNVRSPNQLCRKWTVDFLAGRMSYKDAKDKLRDLDLAGA